MSILSKPYFHDEAAAFEFVESILWSQGPICPFCGSMDRIYALKGVRSKPSKKHPEGVERFGLRKCAECRKQFTVRMGTVFESSHMPLHKWVQAVHLLCASKKGMSAHQLHRVLECQYKTALFMWGRVREAMRSGALAPFGSGGGSVEADETFLLKDKEARPTPPHARPTWVEKMKVLSLVDRDTKSVRSFVVNTLSAAEIAPILRENIAKEARLLTDDAPRYVGHGRMFAAHESVNHSVDEYVRRDNPEIHTNTVESYFSVFKRGMRGTYQHCSKRHLHRYVAEFDFRYNNRSSLGINDEQRAEIALSGARGKRLYYRQPT